MDEIWQGIKDSIGAWLKGAAILLLAVALVVALGYLFKELRSLTPDTASAASTAWLIKLPVLAIGGVVVLIVALTLVAVIFSFLDIANDSQAMGLPEGSIRAVIALSLIVLFAILTVFLYERVADGGQVVTVERLSETLRDQYIKDHPTAQALAITAKTEDGKAMTNPDGTAKYLYDVSFRVPNGAGDDFAKQLLVLLGTLMTAITSFYLGANTATSAAKAGLPPPVQPEQAPTIGSIDPTSHKLGDGPVFTLHVMGSNLNVITHVKLTRPGAVPVVGTNVRSSPTEVTCDVAVTAANIGDPWDVVIDDGGSKTATRPRSLTITA
jgi:hypothetical protein